MTTTLTVERTEWITPVLRRVWLRAEDLSAFADSVFTDRYVKLVFPRPGVDYPESMDLRELRSTMAPEDLPVVRTYTALHPDVEAGTMAIDFVVHGDEGVAGPWAREAEAGDTLRLNGPGGGYRPDPEADWHLLVGDESALPAIGAALDELTRVAPEAVARVVVLVDDPDAEPVLATGPNVRITFVHRGSEQADLVQAVRDLEWLPGRVQVFAHGEAQAIMHGVRPYVIKEREVPRADASISGYWRQGRSEEGFREWKAALRETEGGEAGGRRDG